MQKFGGGQNRKFRGVKIHKFEGQMENWGSKCTSGGGQNAKTLGVRMHKFGGQNGKRF